MRLLSLDGANLQLRVNELLHQGWAPTSIANTMRTPSDVIRGWRQTLPAGHRFTAPVPEPPSASYQGLAVNSPMVLPFKAHAVSKAAKLTPAQAQELHQLAELGQRARAGTNRNARSAKASQALNEVLYQHRVRGISVADMAAAADRTVRSIRDRLPPDDELPTHPEPIWSETTDPDTITIATWNTWKWGRRWMTFVDYTTKKILALPTAWYVLPPNSPVTTNAGFVTVEDAAAKLGWTRDLIQIVQPSENANATGGVEIS